MNAHTRLRLLMAMLVLLLAVLPASAQSATPTGSPEVTLEPAPPTAPAPGDPLDVLDDAVQSGDVRLDNLTLLQAIVDGFRAQNTLSERVIFVAIVILAFTVSAMTALAAYLGVKAVNGGANTLIGSLLKTLLTLGVELADRTPSTNDDRLLRIGAGVFGYEVRRNANGNLELIPKGAAG